MAKNATLSVSARIANALAEEGKNKLFAALSKAKQAEIVSQATGIPVGKVKLVLALDSEVEPKQITLPDGTVIGARGRVPKGVDKEAAKAARLAAKTTA